MINSFEGTEDLTTFANANVIEAYRGNLLKKVALHAEWLAQQTVRPKPFVVVDVGAGSSCLLYSFARGGYLSHGIAIEPARSRHEFAERWRFDGHYDNVENLCATFDQVAPRAGTADMLLLLDNTLSYMYSQTEQHPQMVASLAAKWLRPGGILAVEVLDYVKMPRFEMHVETPQDPRFYASSYYIELLADGTEISETTVYPCNGKVPIKKRDGAKWVRREHLKQILEDTGFASVCFFSEGVPWLKDASYPYYVSVAVSR